MDQEQLEFDYEDEFQDLNLEQQLAQPTRFLKSQNGEKQQIQTNTEMQNKEDITNQKKHLQKPKKPLSAYFLFIQDYKQKCGSKINLKEMGNIWNETSQDEKQIYYKKQEEEKARFKKEMDEYIEQQGDEENEEQLDNELDIAFPISRIKGILKVDEDNKLLSKDTLLYFEKATELFGGYLAQKCFRNMQQNRRKKLQTGDLYEVIKRDMYLNFLQCMVPQEATGEEENQQNVISGSQQSSKTKSRKRLVIADDEDVNQEGNMEIENKDLEQQEIPESSNKKNVNTKSNNKPGKKEKVVLPPANNSRIDSFFTKK
ncbi:histone-like transcription factor and archaeal histone protein (macronuclear) [Tetrahymena thermophila SB210]|uniref:Histone-like transcription factor and archaeal histone protein n=1 Tax=Tetrahymena thermophila (strain SB210) TaxID=312017 RepID=I7MA08_TETTS|nr:histone-like transcription factor and archaeal histone protein [Tetrahymena thermophila SB210]EAS03175.3 histone-like transcription factor and archaeal histone protein [Tetrahymena thermophila SB210]|eukprot:XP_001023420.3 histone-like transcription factor and archaeal histone protein [Tetrahymena thermophila SB210]